MSKNDRLHYRLVGIVVILTVLIALQQMSLGW
jgi:hypothetical protein